MEGEMLGVVGGMCPYGEVGCDAKLMAEAKSGRGRVARGRAGIPFTCDAHWLAKESSLVGLCQRNIWLS